MLQIIFLLLAGSALTYISRYNLELVSLNFGQYTIPDVPLFYVIVGSLLTGLILSYIMQSLTGISTYFKLRDKSKEIKMGQDEVLSLTKRIHQLEIENEKLKHTGPEVSDPHAL